jgi:hypothetical protein
MSRRKVNLVIVCEDVQQSVFARRYLIKRGFEARKIRVVQNPSGRGSGEQFVRKYLVQEVKEYRRKSSFQEGLAVVAFVDADTFSVDERMNQLNNALVEEGLDEIRPNERIAVFIPKRNIETWIRFAQDRNVDEVTAFPKLIPPGSCKREVDLYVNTICRDGIPDGAPPSLIHACHELNKIL